MLQRGAGIITRGCYAARILIWALVLPALKARMPLATLVRLMWVHPRPGQRRPERETDIIRLTGRLYRPRSGIGPHNCLERSLLLYRLLAGAGAGPQLIVAAGRGSRRWPGHAWVLVDGQPVGETPADLRGYVPVAAFGPAGQRVVLPRDSGA